MYIQYSQIHVSDSNWAMSEQNLEIGEALQATKSRSAKLVREAVNRCMKELTGKKVKNEEVIAIDGGSGIGRWCVYFKETFAVKCEGIDFNLSEPHILRAKELGLTLKQGDVLSLPYAANSIDFYMSLGVFEHFEKGIFLPLKEAYRVLKPGGYLLITVPFHNYLRRVLYPLWIARRLLTQVLKKNALKFYAYFFTEKDLLKEVKDAGFLLQSIGPADDIGMGLYLDYSYMCDKNSKGIFPLNKLGRLIRALLNPLSVYFTTWGLLCVCRKPE